MLTLLKFD